MAFKIWKQSPVLKLTAISLAVAAVVLTVWLFVYFSDVTIVKVITLGAIGKWIIGTLVAILAGYLLGSIILVVFWRDSLTRAAVKTGLSLFGWIVSFIHLRFFDKWFLERGSIDSLQRRDDA